MRYLEQGNRIGKGSAEYLKSPSVEKNEIKKEEVHTEPLTNPEREKMTVEQLRKRAQQEAVEVQNHPEQNEPKDEGSLHVTKRQRESAYNLTMHDIREEMSPPAKLFSQLIHNKTIEQISNVLGATLFRPLPLLLGGVTASLGGAMLYFLAKNTGFSLNGFEILVAFIIGWAAGMIVDGIKYLTKK